MTQNYLESDRRFIWNIAFGPTFTQKAVENFDPMVSSYRSSSGKVWERWVLNNWDVARYRRLSDFKSAVVGKAESMDLDYVDIGYFEANGFVTLNVVAGKRNPNQRQINENLIKD